MEPRLKFANDVTVKDGVITAILSTEAVDRDGDVVRLDGWDLGNFNKAPRLMSCHDYSSLTKQIGEWRNVRVDPQLKALVGEPHYYTGMGNPEADWAYELAKLGQATYSVGFMPFDSEPRKGHGGSVFTRQELLECSHVPIPSNQEALQLMAKALLSRERKERRQGGIVRKWDSGYMPNPVDDGWGYPMLELRCIVPGCDDASQTGISVCPEHLKYLVNAPAEPPGGEADEEAEAMVRAFTKRLRVKAGRQISAANMGKLHSAMQSLKDVHDANCTADDCPLDDDGDEEPPEERDKAHKAASEGDGSAGGVTVSDSGTHGAFDGKHGHDHAAPDGGMHDHEHTHDGDGDHGHSHGKAAEAVEQKDENGATQGHDPQALSGLFWKQLAEALEGVPDGVD